MCLYTYPRPATVSKPGNRCTQHDFASVACQCLVYEPLEAGIPRPGSEIQMWGSISHNSSSGSFLVHIAQVVRVYDQPDTAQHSDGALYGVNWDIRAYVAFDIRTWLLSGTVLSPALGWVGRHCCYKHLVPRCRHVLFFAPST